jgi:hypothetical protein
MMLKATPIIDKITVETHAQCLPVQSPKAKMNEKIPIIRKTTTKGIRKIPTPDTVMPMNEKATALTMTSRAATKKSNIPATICRITKIVIPIGLCGRITGGTNNPIASFCNAQHHMKHAITAGVRACESQPFAFGA